MRGAGGTSGGTGRFFIGLIMMCSGFYMLLQSINISTNFGFGMRLMGFSIFGQQVGITSGMVIVPFMFGIGMIFYNSKKILGWVLSIGSVSAMIFGVISSTHFTLRTMTAFELIVILALSMGGLGMFLSSLRNFEENSELE
jgi:hypothetical protein